MQSLNIKITMGMSYLKIMYTYLITPHKAVCIAGRWVGLGWVELFVRPEYTTRVHASVIEGDCTTMSHSILTRDPCLVPR